MRPPLQLTLAEDPDGRVFVQFADYGGQVHNCLPQPKPTPKEPDQPPLFRTEAEARNFVRDMATLAERDQVANAADLEILELPGSPFVANGAEASGVANYDADGLELLALPVTNWNAGRAPAKDKHQAEAESAGLVLNDAAGLELLDLPAMRW